MATKTINTRIVLKTDTEALWTSNNPVLLKGEIGIASDLNKFKIGDGTKKWSELKYAGLSPEEVTKLIGDNRDSVYVYNVPTAAASDENITDTTAITTALGSNTAKQGDMAIIIREIGKWSNGTFTGTGKQAHTAYVYDGAAWKAMDGNYSADNVYLSKDITMAGNYTTVGNLSKSQNGTGTFSTKGLSVTDAFQKIFTKVLQPTITSNPEITLTAADNKAYEVGTSVTPTYKATLSAGSYTYGPNTGITATSWSVTNNLTGESKETFTTSTGSFKAITVADNTNYTITATATYPDGAVAKDNVGGQSNPIVKISGGTKSKTSATITGYRAWFTYVGNDTSAINSEFIRKGINKGANVTNVNLAIPAGTKRVLIAIPATNPKKALASVIDVDGMGLDVKDNFVKTSVNVEGANGATAVAYNVFSVDNANGLAKTTYKVSF